MGRERTRRYGRGGSRRPQMVCFPGNVSNVNNVLVLRNVTLLGVRPRPCVTLRHVTITRTPQRRDALRRMGVTLSGGSAVALVDVLEDDSGLRLEDIGRIGARKALVQGLLDGVAHPGARLRRALPVYRQ